MPTPTTQFVRISTATQEAIADAEAAYRHQTSLIPADLMLKLIQNGKRRDEAGYDPPPLLKLFCPWSVGTWLLVDADPDEPGRLFGLCDVGEPELGYVSLDEIEELRGPGGLRIERDLFFTATKPLSVYAEEARTKGRIDA